MSKKSYQEAILKSKPACIVISVLAIVMGIIFIISQSENTPISRNQAVSHSGEFESYEGYKNYCYINFLNGESYFVYPHTVTNEFEAKMNSLKQGTKLSILVNPKNDCVVEVLAGTEEILNFKASQKNIDSYDNGYIVLGIVISVSGVAFFIATLIEILNNRKQKILNEAKIKNLEFAVEDSPIIYSDNTGKKCRILLKTTVNGDIEIVYRRRMFTNELMINNNVYDQKWAIIEFPHKLFAKVNGKIIEAGLNEASKSYIAVDGKIIKRKERVI